MKNLLLLFSFIFSIVSFAQELDDSIYFPQEQLTHPNCKKATNKNACLKSEVSKLFTPTIKKALLQKKIKKDTLNVTVSFSVDSLGVPNKKYGYAFVNDSTLRVDYEKEIESITEQLPQFSVSHKKPSEYSCRHDLDYSFVIDHQKNKFKLLKSNEKENYTGGAIIEPPVFPGCEKTYGRNRSCLNSKILKHIAKTFQYPEIAQEVGISGRVFMLFKIGEDGIVKMIKARGPHPSLEKEGIRIITLLPTFEPGLKNGKPIAIPFSIPISFKLQ